MAVARRWLSLSPGTLAAKQQNISRYFAFDVDKRRSAGIINHDGRQLFVVKGGFEALQPMVTAVGLTDSSERDLPLQGQLADSETAMRQMAAQGLRVIAVAFRPLAAEETEDG
ncbi:MAG: hypothetical protein ACD_75C02304G0001, partial [uncultured bacterium]